MRLEVRLKAALGGGKRIFTRAARSDFDHSSDVVSRRGPKASEWHTPRQKGSSDIHTFSSIERIRIVQWMVEARRLDGGAQVNVVRAIQRKYIAKFFPLHEDSERLAVKKRWLSRLQQPMTYIRGYFGEYVAFYFAFMRFYTLWLWIPAIIGLAIFIYQLVTQKVDAEPLPFFGLLVAVWSTFFMEFWKRRQSSLAFRWGTFDFEETERVRQEYRGKMRRSEVTGRLERYESPVLHLLKVGFSGPVTAVLLVAVGGAIFGIAIFKTFLAAQQVFWGWTFAASILSAIAVKVMDKAYELIAFGLTSFENHRTDTAYEDSLILKLFGFKFINANSSLFYLAFVAEPENRMWTLQVQLASLLLFRQILRHLTEWLVPALKRYLKRKNPELKKMSKAETESNLKCVDSTIPDFTETMIQFGLTNMFVVAFPLAPFASLINNFLEGRKDAFNFCTYYRRPEGRPASDIGTWMAVMQVLSVFSVVTNVGVVCFVSKQLDWYYPVRDLAGTIVAALILEHAILLLKIVVYLWVPDVPAQIRTGLRRQAYMLHQVQEAERRAHDAEMYGQPPADDIWEDSDGDDDDSTPLAVSGPLSATSATDVEKGGHGRGKVHPQD